MLTSSTTTPTAQDVLIPESLLKKTKAQADVETYRAKKAAQLKIVSDFTHSGRFVHDDKDQYCSTSFTAVMSSS
jgi:hypothetical protein